MNIWQIVLMAGSCFIVWGFIFLWALAMCKAAARGDEMLGEKDG